MKYAVVKIGGSQYKVEEGSEFAVDRLPRKEGEEVEFTEVLLLVEEDQVKIGQPILSDIQVKAKVLSHIKGEKIRVARYKAKSRYRKVKGFRAALTKIKIEKIATRVRKSVPRKKASTRPPKA